MTWLMENRFRACACCLTLLDRVDGICGAGDDVWRHAQVPQRLVKILAGRQAPLDVLFERRNFLLVIIILVEEQPTVRDDGIGVFAGRVRDEDSEILWYRSIA